MRNAVAITDSDGVVIDANDDLGRRTRSAEPSRLDGIGRACELSRASPRTRAARFKRREAGWRSRTDPLGGTHALRDGVKSADLASRQSGFDRDRPVVGRPARRGCHAHRYHASQAGGGRDAATARGDDSRGSRDDDGDAVGDADARDESTTRGDPRERSDCAPTVCAQEPGDSEEVDVILGDVVSASRRAGSILQRLRGWFSNGRNDSEPLGVNDVANDVIEILRGDLLRRGVTLTRRLSPALPIDRGDRVQLQQVVLNLILNACDAMQGQPTWRPARADHDGSVRRGCAPLCRGRRNRYNPRPTQLGVRAVRDDEDDGPWIGAGALSNRSCTRTKAG